MTWVTEAIINDVLTIGTTVSDDAEAGISIDSIDTGGTIGARHTGTLVNVGLAAGARKSGTTNTDRHIATHIQTGT